MRAYTVTIRFANGHELVVERVEAASSAESITCVLVVEDLSISLMELRHGDVKSVTSEEAEA